MARMAVTFFLLVVAAAPTFAGGPPLQSADETTSRTYDSITELSGIERRAMYRTLSPSTRAELWILHFQQVLHDHPDLTAAERSVILEGIGLIRSGSVDFSLPAAEQNRETQESIAALQYRAQAALSADLVRLTFGEIGGEQRVVTPAHRFHVTTNAPPTDCICNVGSLYTCGGPSDPLPYCFAPLQPSCTIITSGCGFLWLYICDGLCRSTP